MFSTTLFWYETIYRSVLNIIEIARLSQKNKNKLDAAYTFDSYRSMYVAHDDLTFK